MDLKDQVLNFFIEGFRETGRATFNLSLDILKESGQIFKRTITGKTTAEDQKGKTEKQSTPKIPRELTQGEIQLGTIRDGFLGKPFMLPQGDFKFKVIRGGSRNGKTTSITNYVVNLARAGRGVSYIDNTDGEAIRNIIKALPQEVLDRLILLDHSDEHYPIGVGHLESTGDIFKDAKIVEMWIKFFESNFEIEGKYMTEELMRYAMKAVFGISGSTLLDVITFIEEASFRKHVIARLNRNLYQDVIDWWEKFNDRSSSKQREMSEAFLRRAKIMFNNPTLKYSLGQIPKQPLNYRQWMDEGKIVLINVPESLTALPVRVIVSLHVLGFWQAALSRDNIPDHTKRVPFVLFTDEPQTWLDGNKEVIDNLFSKAQKYGLGIIAAFQSDSQIGQKGKELLNIMLDNSPDLLIFKGKGSTKLNLDPYDPVSIPRYYFIAKIGDHDPVLVKASLPATSIRSDITDIVKKFKNRYNQHYLIVHNEIERRGRMWEGRGEESDNQLKSLKNGSKCSVSQGSKKEILRSSDSSIRIE